MTTNKKSIEVRPAIIDMIRAIDAGEFEIFKALHGVSGRSTWIFIRRDITGRLGEYCQGSGYFLTRQLANEASTTAFHIRIGTAALFRANEYHA